LANRKDFLSGFDILQPFDIYELAVCLLEWQKIEALESLISVLTDSMNTSLL
jgi:hypothetical protein